MADINKITGAEILAQLAAQIHSAGQRGKFVGQIVLWSGSLAEVSARSEYIDAADADLNARASSVRGRPTTLPPGTYNVLAQIWWLPEGGAPALLVEAKSTDRLVLNPIMPLDAWNSGAQTVAFWAWPSQLPHNAWIGLYEQGASHTNFLDWKYLNGTKLASAGYVPAASGKLSFGGSLAAAEVRLFGGAYNHLAVASIRLR